MPLLCPDDLDKMQRKDDGSYQKAQISTLFDQRYKARRPVIITANSDDDWHPWLYEVTLSRPIGHATAIRMQGHDYRLMRALQA